MKSRFNSLNNPDFASINRNKTAEVLIWLVSVLFIFRLGWLQLVQGSEFKESSLSQAIKKVRLEPYRGNIFDRNRRLIVHNEPSFSVTITPYEFRDESLDLLASILKVDPLEISSILKKYKRAGFSPFTPIKLFRDVNFETISLVALKFSANINLTSLILFFSSL